MGRILKNIRVFNVFLRKFEEKQVKIENGIFTLVEAYCPPSETDEVIDGGGLRMIPGLIDIHMHIESSMTIPHRFERYALFHGVTTIVADPHEIANVFGIDGIEAFMDCPTELDIFYGIPSSVPSTRVELETTGGSISVPEVAKLLKNKRVRCLGEVMNFMDLVSEEDTEIKRIIALCKQTNPWLPIEGHCPKIGGESLSRFIAAGVDSDHTQQSASSIQEKIGKGMFLEIQRKSLSQETIQMIAQLDAYAQIALVSDDVMCDHLIEGHLNGVVAKAISLGMPFELAVLCSTYIPAKRMGFYDRGAIAPGKIADFILLKEVDGLVIDRVCKNGKFLEELSFPKEVDFPKRFYHSVHRKPLVVEELQLPSHQQGVVVCNVMQLEPHSNFTKWVQREVPIVNQQLAWWETNLSLLCCVERYGKSDRIAFGLVENGLTQGAVCSSWAHDHHNLMAMGRNVEDMVFGLNHLISIQGGYCVVDQQEIMACLALPIGGIVSDAPIDEMARDLGLVREAMHRSGYVHDNAIMSFATLSLPVSPEIKLTDRGLILGQSLRIVPLMEGETNENTN